MTGLDDPNICPRCDSPNLRSWAELTDEQKFLAERLPLSAEYTPAERKKHRFCTRCWFEDRNIQAREA